VQNPSPTDAEVTFTYMDTNGNTAQETATVSANSRYSRNINAVTGMNNKPGVSTQVQAAGSVGIIAERAMYWNGGGIESIGGHCSKGAVNPSTMRVYAGRS